MPVRVLIQPFLLTSTSFPLPSAVVNIIVSLGIAFYSGWQLTLVILAFTPLLVLGGYLHTRFLTAKNRQDKKVRVIVVLFVCLFVCLLVSFFFVCLFVRTTLSNILWVRECVILSVIVAMHSLAKTSLSKFRVWSLRLSPPLRPSKI